MEYRFTTCLNCIDGEVQVPVFEWIKKNYNVDYINMITDVAMVSVLSDKDLRDDITEKLKHSLKEYNHIKSIFIVGYANCLGNDTDQRFHKSRLLEAVQNIKNKFPENCIIGLWISQELTVEKMLERC